jgi:hypothetical protein
MGTHETETSLEEQDRATREAISAAEEAILRLIEDQRIESFSALRVALDEADLGIDRSFVRTALLRLLDRDSLHLDAGSAVAAR